jgi:hypothetical protein
MGAVDLMAFNGFDVCRTHGPGTGGLGGGRLREGLMMTDIYASGPGKKSVSRPSTDQRTRYGGFPWLPYLDHFAVSQRTVEHGGCDHDPVTHHCFHGCSSAPSRHTKQNRRV